MQRAQGTETAEKRATQQSNPAGSFSLNTLPICNTLRGREDFAESYAAHASAFISRTEKPAANFRAACP